MIPVFINNRDWLSSTRLMADRLASLGVPVTIVDNASTYPPLLEWYDNCPHRVIRLQENIGLAAPWRCQAVPDPDELFRRYGTRFYAVSDSDLDLAETPDDFLEVLADAAGRWPRMVKVGLSLRLYDIPRQSPIWPRIRRTQKRHYERKCHGRFYLTGIDTTMAVYRAAQRNPNRRRPALRTAPPYQARHLPWYLTPENLSDEAIWHLKHSEVSSVWARHLRKALRI